MFSDDCNLLLMNVMEGLSHNNKKQAYPKRGEQSFFFKPNIIMIFHSKDIISKYETILFFRMCLNMYN